MSIALIAIFLLAGVLPEIASAEPSEVVPVDVIMVKLKLGEPVIYDNIIVKGNLSSDRLCLPARQILRIPFDVKTTSMDSSNLANSTLSITNSTIDGWVNFNNTLFQKPVSFQGTVFAHDSSFRNCTFSEGAFFAESWFIGAADFMQSQFMGPADFSLATLTGPAIFLNSQFDDLCQLLSQ